MNMFFQSELFINLSYILASILFIFGLKMLSSPETAQRGNFISALGMLLAIVVTLMSNNIISYQWLSIALIAGAIVGASAASFVKMTTMPELVALFNGFGGIASLLVGSAEFLNITSMLSAIALSAVFLTVLIGGVTFTGSLLAFGKLSEIIDGKPFLYFGQRIVLVIFIILAFTLGIEIVVDSGLLGISRFYLLVSLVLIALILGILLTAPIGGADMPVIIALLNSYSGVAAAAAGFVINNNVLIVAGSLVGASGLILTNIMCKAMNRSLANVLFGGFGAVTASGGNNSGEIQGEVKPINASDAYLILEAANSVLFVPGYGMAVSQAQHSVRELGELLEENGCEVNYGIHPVAGRMPGHMNVLLAEANVPYEEVLELDEINHDFPMTEVSFVIGANDVTNPAAKTDESSPIFGMPILDVEKSQSVLFVKRSMATGYSGVDNELFYRDNTTMLFGDAKKCVRIL